MHIIRQNHKIMFVLLFAIGYQSLHTAESRKLILGFSDRSVSCSADLTAKLIGGLSESRTVSDLFGDQGGVSSGAARDDKNVVMVPLSTIRSLSFKKLAEPLIYLSDVNARRKKIMALPIKKLVKLCKINTILQCGGISEEIARSWFAKERVAQFIKRSHSFSSKLRPIQHECDVVHDLVQNLTARHMLVFAAPEKLSIETDYFVLSPDGTRLVSQNRERITVFDLINKADGPIYDFDKNKWNMLNSDVHLMWNKSGTHCAFRKSLCNMYIFDVFQAQQPERHQAFHNFAFDWNGTDFAYATGNNWWQHDIIALSDVAGKQPPRLLHGHQADVFAAALSPVGNKLASLGLDGTMRIWDAKTNTQLTYGQFDLVQRGASFNQHELGCLKWSPDESQLAYYNRKNGTLYIWDTASGTLLRTLNTEKIILSNVRRYWRYGLSNLNHPTVCSLAWNPSGSMLALSTNDKTLDIWDVVSGLLINIIKLPDYDCRSFASVDWGVNNMLVVATSDRVVRAFDMNNSVKLSEIMKNKMSLSQLMLMKHILDYDSVSGAEWFKRLKKDKQTSIFSSKNSHEKSQEEKNEEYLVSLLYSLPTELKSSLKQWLATGFVMQKPSE